MTLPTRQHLFCSVLALTASTLSGCRVGPDYEPPEPDAPVAWDATSSSPEATATVAEASSARDWWKYLDDPLLSELIEGASHEGIEPRAALERIEQARARFRLARGERWPDLDGIGSYRRVRTSENGTNNRVAGFQFADRDIWTLGAEMSWEIDLWGRVRRLNEAAKAEADASVEDLRDVIVLLQAEVANSYIGVRMLQQRIAILDSNLAMQEKSTGLARARFDAGVAAELDVSDAEATLAASRADRPRLAAELAIGMNRLAVLLGQQPGSLSERLRQDGTATSIPQPPDQLTVDVPAEVIRQRPDVRRAERLLAAATARIGVKTAELYPQFTLFGSFTLEATRSASDLFESGSEAFSFGPSFRWHLFDGGRVRSAIDVEDARTAEALVIYEGKVLGAFEEVESALHSHLNERQRLTLLDEAVARATRSTEIVDGLYEQGTADYLRVIESQRRLRTIRDDQSRTRGRLAQSFIALYRALGGGWQLPDS